ncbi:MAG: hypothetical protein AAGF24_05275 [Cyanobacteria bacterium P01_H01_bin.121]
MIDDLTEEQLEQRLQDQDCPVCNFSLHEDWGGSDPYTDPDACQHYFCSNCGFSAYDPSPTELTAMLAEVNRQRSQWHRH